MRQRCKQVELLALACVSVASAGCPAGTYFSGIWQTGTSTLTKPQSCPQSVKCEKAECRSTCLRTQACKAVLMEPSDAGNYIQDASLCMGDWAWGGDCKCARCTMAGQPIRSCTYCGEYCSTVATPQCSQCPVGTMSVANSLSPSDCLSCPTGKHPVQGKTCEWDPMVIVMFFVVGVLLVSMIFSVVAFVLMRFRRHRAQMRQPPRYAQASQNDDDDMNDPYMALEPEEPPPPYSEPDAMLGTAGGLPRFSFDDDRPAEVVQVATVRPDADDSEDAVVSDLVDSQE